MKNRIIIAAALFLSVVLILAILLISISVKQKNKESIQSIITIIDADLENGLYNDTEKLLKLAASKADDSLSWLMILKRSYLLSGIIEDYSLFQELSKLAMTDLGGRDDIRICSIFADIRSGNYEIAIKNSLKYFADKTEYQSLISEALLKTDPETDFDLHSLGSYNFLLNCVTSNDPYIMQEAAENFNNNELFLNAALLRLYNGNFQNAFLVAEDYLVDKYPDFFLITAFDSGKYRKVIELISNADQKVLKDEIKVLIGESYLKLEDNKSAFSFYTNFILEYPAFSPVPYLNLSYLTIDNNIDDSIEYLLNGLKFFPGNDNLYIALAALYGSENQYNDAEEVLAILFEIDPENIAAQLIGLKISNINNKERYTSELWKMFNKNDDNTMLTLYFLWFTAGSGDLESMKIILSRFKGDPGEWIDFYYGLSAVFDCDYITAKEYFLSSNNKKERWESIYNAAIISFYEEDFGVAIELFRNAESKLILTPFTEDRSENIGQIRIKIGLVLYKSNDLEGALREIRYGLEMSPSNLEGELLLKMLEEKLVSY